VSKNLTECATGPQALLYATGAGYGGPGLHTTSLEGVRAALAGGYLKRAVGFASRAKDLPSGVLKSLDFHPVRLLSALGSERYYGAKKRYVDWISARMLSAGGYDFFHGWSGDCLLSLIAAKQHGIPAVMDIPTWHRNKGAQKRFETRSERELRLKKGLRAWLDRLPVSRQRVLLEYELADRLLMPSECSAATFRVAGVPERKLHYVGRGVDVQRYRPAEERPKKFTALFAGALIKRKGVHHLIEAWQRLALPEAELVLVGSAHPEMASYLAEASATAERGAIRVVGFTARLEDYLRQASIFVFPSECEGFAKVTLEAAACGLPLIGTKESGDAIIDGVTGFLIPAQDVSAIERALRQAYDQRERLPELGHAARRMVEEKFTWDHYRARVEQAYQSAWQEKVVSGPA
jgi:glycosyltransferase involved in cell wall biosynthesis